MKDNHTSMHTSRMQKYNHHDSHKEPDTSTIHMNLLLQ